MGSPAGEPNRRQDEIPHRVAIRKGFYMGIYEVTQGQWRAVTGRNPARIRGDDLPVERVSWIDCRAFLAALTTAGPGVFRLPTEAEWEYACRAGTKTPFSFGPTISPAQANYRGTKRYADGPKGVYRGTLTPVGHFAPNGFGLYDMHGNVGEWCSSKDQPYPYGEDGREDPTGDAWRILRGGSWYERPRFLRSAARIAFHPRSPDGRDGLRIVWEPGAPGD
jgi:formylglycine-generating enzyme required for sulfatase activity